MTLVILAAGMGSRFGGLKQIEPIGPNGEFIIDYSIYDAIKAGFTKVVFIIKKENYEIFKDTIGKRIEDKVQVEYVFQSNDIVPDGIVIPETRVKPLGTAHAIYVANDKINGNFGVITADDFYGDDAFRVLSKEIEGNYHVIVGYPLWTTMSENGSVKRGVIKENNGIVESIIECSCELVNNKIKCIPLDSSKSEFIVEKDNLCSMLMNGFTSDILDTIGNVMESYLKEHSDELDTYEVLLPDILDLEIRNGKEVKVVDTSARWMGITYREDLKKLKNFINQEIDKGVYPKDLWRE